MLKKITFLLIVSLFIAFRTCACLNTYVPVTNAKGEISEIDLYDYSIESFRPFKNGFDDKSLVKIKREILRKITNRKANYKDLSDLASIELKIGDRKHAVKVLDSLYKIYPNEYNIVVNLGTGYELIGNNQKALELIDKAVKINPESHNHSEWIHVEILKQKLAKNPDYASIMNLNLKGSLFDNYTYFNSPQNTIKLNELINKRNALQFQLNERIAFIGPEDKCIGMLLYNLAEIQSITDFLDQSKVNYEQALIYDPTLMSVINPRLNEVRTKIYWSRIKNNTFEIISGIIAISLLLFFRVLIIKRQELKVLIVFVSYLIPLFLFFPIIAIAKLYFYEINGDITLIRVNFIVLLILGLLYYFSLLKNTFQSMLLKLQILEMFLIFVLIILAFNSSEDFYFVSVFIISFISVLIPHLFLRYFLWSKTA